ncbi:MAG: purine-nucleoside phosphorylase [Planctomycetales bacterium]|nr:purine-nucleoside phosphorylase [Planctomycetales bacterium]
MEQLTTQIREAAESIRDCWTVTPRVGIILGSGLGDFADEIATEAVIPYASIPHFPQSTALGHKGQFVCGTLSKTPVMAMQGRFHLYEGYPPAAATLPVHVMKRLGIRTLIVSNASGGLNPMYGSGEIMLIEDHINMMFANPLIGSNDDQLGPRFPDMCSPYDPWLIEVAEQVARRSNFRVHRGVYAAMLGPTYETRAEYRFLRQIGADVVGMSTVPEVLAAVHAAIPVLAISVVTNLCRPDTLGETSGQEVVDVAQTAASQMRAIVCGIIDSLEQRTC